MSINNFQTLFHGIVRPSEPSVQFLSYVQNNGQAAYDNYNYGVGVFGCGNVISNISISSTLTIPDGTTFSIQATNVENPMRNEFLNYDSIIYNSIGSTYSVCGNELGNPLAQDSILHVSSNFEDEHPISLSVTYMSS